MQVEVTPSGIPRGRWLAIARAVWIALTALTLGVYIVGIPTAYERLKAVCVGAGCTQWRLSSEGANALREAGLSVEFYAASGIALSALSAFVFLAVAVLLFRQRSGEWMALLLSLYLVLNAPGGNFLTELSQSQIAWSWLISLLGYLSMALFVPLFYLFPDGRFVPPWTRVLAAAWFVLQFAYYFFPDVLQGPDPWFAWLMGMVFVGYLLSMVFAQGYRYRRVSNLVQRQQTKWVVFGLVVMILGWFVLAWIAEGSLLPVLYGEFAGLAVDPFSILLPLCIGIAILRYRLWDIDLLINRTLVYTALTGCVVGIYILIVGYLGTLFRTGGNLAISLIATGVVAVLFQLLRERIQRGVNRLMYGERDDPYTVLTHLGQRLEATLAPDAALTTIVETIKEALKLPYAAIEMTTDDRRRMIEEQQPMTDNAAMAETYTAPSNIPPLLRFPLSYQNETVGHLVVAPRSPGERFSAADLRLLEDLARQAGVAVHAVRLTTDLQQARTQLVTTREEERRRIRRDLHDGLGPTLATLALQADSARDLVRPAPDVAEQLLAEVVAQAQAAIADIRRLVYGLRPPALDEMGLVGALRALLTQQATGRFAVHLDAPAALPPLPAAVEVAAYRIIQEALTNVVRHAGARCCTVRLAAEHDLLVVEVADNGQGLPKHHSAGVGLHSMRERAEELSGTMQVDSASGAGTRIRVHLPLGTVEQEHGEGSLDAGHNFDPDCR